MTSQRLQAILPVKLIKNVKIQSIKALLQKAFGVSNLKAVLKKTDLRSKAELLWGALVAWNCGLFQVIDREALEQVVNMIPQSAIETLAVLAK